MVDAPSWWEEQQCVQGWEDYWHYVGRQATTEEFCYQLLN